MFCLLKVSTTKDFALQYTESEAFDNFVSEMKAEAQKNGEDFDLNDEEARDLFSMMQDEFSDLDDVDDGPNSESDVEAFDDALDKALLELKEHGSESDGESDLRLTQIRELLARMNTDFDKDSVDDLNTESESFEGKEVDAFIPQESEIADADDKTNILSVDLVDKSNPALAALSPDQLSKIEDLQSALPGMPIQRLRKILNAYEETLGHPSTLTLVPLLRETMPDYLSSGWLKRSNKQNADFALQKASEDGIVDSSLFNSMLEVKANSGSLNEALEYHKNQFAKHELVSS